MRELERARAALRDDVDEARVQRMWTVIDARRVAPKRRIRRSALAIASVVVAFAVAWVAWPSRAPVVRSTALRLATEAPLPARFVGEVRLSDASRVEVDDDARVDVLENDARTLGLALRRGRARFEVTPGGPRAWRVEAGAVSVHVVGTVFEVHRSSDGVLVEVERGAVLVRGVSVPDQVQRLEAGARLFVRSAPEVPERSVEVATTRVVPAVRPVAPRWRESAANARYDEAFDALGGGGIARETVRARDVRDLWMLADVARFSGHPEDAAAPLRRLITEHPRDDRSALAAYTLGRIELDALDRPAEAAEHLARGVALGLPAALREPAAARHVEALGRAGRLEDAAAAARDYLSDHPAGARRAEVERWLDR